MPKHMYRILLLSTALLANNIFWLMTGFYNLYSGGSPERGMWLSLICGALGFILHMWSVLRQIEKG